jgi:hypothetical protein
MKKTPLAAVLLVYPILLIGVLAGFVARALQAGYLYGQTCIDNMATDLTKKP